VLILSYLLTSPSCKKNSSIEPPPISDSLITIEQVLADGQEPAVSPDGTRIAYTRDGSIYVMDTSGANIKQITQGNGDVLPRWRPDGQAIGFIRTVAGSYNQGLLYSVPSSGGAPTLINFGQPVADSLIEVSRVYTETAIPIWDWSYDASLIAYLAVKGSSTFLDVESLVSDSLILSREIFNANSANPTRSFAWSSKSNKLVFTSCLERSDGIILTYQPPLPPQIADTTYLFPSYITQSHQVEEFSYYVYVNASRGPTIRSNDFAGNTAEYSVSSAAGLKWSPDNNYFLYEWEWTVGGALGYDYSRLYLFDRATGKQYKLTSEGDINYHDFFFDWGKNSNTVFSERFKKIYKIQFKH